MSNGNSTLICIRLLIKLIMIIAIFTCSFIVQVRFVKGDNFWLSNDYQRDGCHVTLLLHNPSDYYTHLYFDTYFQIVLKYGGRPHWGKALPMSFDEAKSLYPKLDEFIEVYHELDPDRIFANDLLENILGI